MWMHQCSTFKLWTDLDKLRFDYLKTSRGTRASYGLPLGLRTRSRALHFQSCPAVVEVDDVEGAAVFFFFVADKFSAAVCDHGDFVFGINVIM